MSAPRIIVGEVLTETADTVTISTPTGPLTALKSTGTHPVIVIVDGSAVLL